MTKRYGGMDASRLRQSVTDISTVSRSRGENWLRKRLQVR